jgi:hypothetical protein
VVLSARKGDFCGQSPALRGSLGDSQDEFANRDVSSERS